MKTIECNKPKGNIFSNIDDSEEVMLIFQGWGTRYTYSVMCFLAWTLCYSVRVDMSIAIVAMVNTSESF